MGMSETLLVSFIRTPLQQGRIKEYAVSGQLLKCVSAMKSYFSRRRQRDPINSTVWPASGLGCI